VIFGDFRQLMPRPYCEIVLVATAFLCGALWALNAKGDTKPAGLRTLILKSVSDRPFLP